MKNLECRGEVADTQDLLCGILRSRVGRHSQSRCGELPAMPDAEKDKSTGMVPIGLEHQSEKTAPTQGLCECQLNLAPLFQRMLAPGVQRWVESEKGTVGAV